MIDSIEACLVSLEGDATEFHATFRFPASHPVFAGHFPGSPLVPGIFLIEAVHIAADRAAGVRTRIREVREAKFTARVLPDENLEIRGSIEGDRCRAKLGSGTVVSLDLSEGDC